MAAGKSFWDIVGENKGLQWGLAALIGLPTLFFAGWAVKKYVIGSVTRSGDEKTADQLGKEVNKNRLSYPATTYKTMADVIYRAMDGAGTTWETITRVLGQLKNADDWKMLVAEFGERKSTVWLSTFSGNLISWLEDELDESEMKEISAMLNKINVVI